MQAIFDRPRGESGIVFFAGKALFLRSSNNFPVNKDHGSAVMVKGGEAQNID